MSIKKISEMKTMSDVRNSSTLPVIKMDVSFLRPLAYWHEYMTEDDRKKLPARVINALDSVHTILKGRL